MIITQNALLAIGGCAVIVQHLVDTGYDGLTRLQFIQKLQEDADAGVNPQWWVTWCKTYLYDGNAIAKLGEFTRNQRYDIHGMNISEDYPIFTDLQAAIDEVKVKLAEQVASEEWLFHINAECPQGTDAHTLHNCDLDGDGVFDHPVTCYQVFNHATGGYERFEDFVSARARCDEIRQDRLALLKKSYHITEEIQQINDPEENPSGWILVDIGAALD